MFILKIVDKVHTHSIKSIDCKIAFIFELVAECKNTILKDVTLKRYNMWTYSGRYNFVIKLTDSF